MLFTRQGLGQCVYLMENIPVMLINNSETYTFPSPVYQYLPGSLLKSAIMHYSLLHMLHHVRTKHVYRAWILGHLAHATSSLAYTPRLILA
jgi:hypothetical protein